MCVFFIQRKYTANYIFNSFLECLLTGRSFQQILRGFLFETSLVIFLKTFTINGETIYVRRLRLSPFFFRVHKENVELISDILLSVKTSLKCQDLYREC